jgi:HD superfamily phosphodiesterase
MNESSWPSRKEAEDLLLWGYQNNPGTWLEHSRVVARAAETIALNCSLDGDKAAILGLLHDIGRYEGVTGLRHIFSGYKLMNEKGYSCVARICLTHTFSYKNIHVFQGKFDCSEAEESMLKEKLEEIEYDDYDKLLQLCDSISLAEGVCTLEKRLIDVAKRNGVNDLIQEKWNSYFALKEYFDKKCNENIYKYFYEEVIKNSVG